MKKIKVLSILVFATIVLFTSCSTAKSEYFVNDTPYITQGAGEFKEPRTPKLAENEILEGWVLEGTDYLYQDWAHQPEGLSRFDAQITVLDYINFMVEDKVFDTQLETEFHDPGTPEMPDYLPETAEFVGWIAEGSDEINENWSTPTALVYNADFVDYATFYVNGVEWKKVDIEEFGNPGEPAGKDVPRGYEFVGWILETDYLPYEDWDVVPENARRFDALLLQTTIQSGIESSNQILRLNLSRNIDVLGPVTISETYEIIDCKVKIGGIGYKDLLAAAIELYPETDQVINIITDYETHEYVSELSTITFQTKSYTGIAIDID